MEVAGSPPAWKIALTCLGGYLSAGGAGAINHVYDRDIDARMNRTATRPVWDGKQFAPRLILPLSLSFDHRVIDGAGAARFNSYLAQVLADFRRVLL